MNERLEEKFLVEIFVQYSMASSFANNLDQAVRAHDDINIWCSIQGLLVTTANISKLLWPSAPAGSRANKRGGRLRDILKVPDDCVLKDRKFRNHFEHFDERLDQWAESQEEAPTGLMDGWINYGGGQFVGDPRTLLRIFHAPDWTLTFYGEQYRLEEVIKAIVGVAKSVEAVLRDRKEKRKAQNTGR